ncbi:MAG: radical SAM protein [Deltaproteobacteria bacterium]|nr:radical SAM protein [Deltaproteobacteria bacterium]
MREFSVEMNELSSPWKVARHKEKLEAYLRGEPVYPVTLELDITTACNRECPGCPSASGPFSRNLDMAFIRHLFSLIGGRTKGLLLTGGEPTISPIFPDVLREARRSGFEEIAVVTNGSFLAEEKVA